VEIKRRSAPGVERGFHFACEDLKLKERFVVYPGEDRYPLDARTEVIGLRAMAQSLQAAK